MIANTDGRSQRYNSDISDMYDENERHSYGTNIVNSYTVPPESEDNLQVMIATCHGGDNECDFKN